MSKLVMTGAGYWEGGDSGARRQFDASDRPSDNAVLPPGIVVRVRLLRLHLLCIDTKKHHDGEHRLPRASKPRPTTTASA